MVLGLSSFGSLGPGIVVFMVLGLSSFGSWDCRPLGPMVLGSLSSLWSSGWMAVVVLSILCLEGRKKERRKRPRHGLLI